MEWRIQDGVSTLARVAFRSKYGTYSTADSHGKAFGYSHLQLMGLKAKVGSIDVNRVYFQLRLSGPAVKATSDNFSQHLQFSWVMMEKISENSLRQLSSRIKTSKAKKG